MKYIPADKLIAEIERYENTAIEAYNPKGEDADFWDGKVVACEDIKAIITSSQEEYPEVDMKKELEQWRHKHFKGKRDGDYSGEYLERESQLDIARHFYELGQSYRYQIDREEFAKLKAKEWEDGYNEGYAKGFKVRKEENK